MIDQMDGRGLGRGTRTRHFDDWTLADEEDKVRKVTTGGHGMKCAGT